MSVSPYIAGEVMSSLGLTGPCITVDTACSSSMSALSMAVNDLQCGNCQYALVAGRYNLMTGPCITLDTACSSSMSALSMAVNDLQCGNCQYALVAVRYNLMTGPCITVDTACSSSCLPSVWLSVISSVATANMHWLLVGTIL